jgi:hypothetical protein
MVSERKTRDQVLQLVRDGRSRLDAALADAPEDEATKAMLAHVMHWEQVMVQRLGGTSPPVGDETWAHYPEHVAQLEARARTSGKG